MTEAKAQIIPAPASSSALPRDYRKGNWTVHETLTLITAKRLDDERRSKGGGGGGGGGGTPRSAEQRWKWVENYCWTHDCLRSQNQCNDKWDNLLRDYKKVRDFEAKVEDNKPSYWSFERHERKDRNLPTNLSLEVFEALTDVLNRRNARRRLTAAASPSPLSSMPPPPQPATAEIAGTPMPTPPPQPATATASVTPQPSGPAEISDSDESDADEPEPKRRKLKSLGSSVVRSASVLAQTLMTCEEKREQRHRELLELEERRVKLEEERTEMSRQAVSGLISAVNGLSNAIHALVSGQRGGDRT